MAASKSGLLRVAGCKDPRVSLPPDELALCGDGLIDPEEGCDDGNLVDGDGCSGSCADEALCGDGVLDPGEACDEGVGNDDLGLLCTSLCRPPSCDDGFANGQESDVDCGAVCGAGSRELRQSCDAPETCDRSLGTVVCDLVTERCDERIIMEVVAGLEHTCVLFNDGAVRCWGSNQFGQLGVPGVPNVGLAGPAWEAGDVVLGGPASHISAGTERT